MSSRRALYHMVKADFLERIRRYSFLLTLAFSVYLGYAVYSGIIVLHLGNYRGVNNSASVRLGHRPPWLALAHAGRLLHRQKHHSARPPNPRPTILTATTPISKGFYTVSKMLSNLAVLAAMVGVLALSAIVVQLLHPVRHPH